MLGGRAALMSPATAAPAGAVLAVHAVASAAMNTALSVATVVQRIQQSSPIALPQTLRFRA
jgi:hypothetical protein